MALSAEQALQHWERDGLLSKEKAAELRKDLEGSAVDVPHRAITIFSAFGAVLVGLGIILFIASNWAELTPLVKVLLLLIAVLATGIGGYWLAYEKKTHPIVGQALLFINTFAYGASIFLIGQIYNLPLNYWWGMLLWFLGCTYFAYAMRSKLHLWLSIPLLIFFLGWLRTEAVMGFSELDFLFDHRSNILSILPVIGAGLIAKSLLYRNYAPFHFGEGIVFHWGLFLILLPLVVSTADKQVFFPIFDITWDPVAIIILLLSLFSLVAAFFRATFTTKQGKWSLVALTLYLAFVYLLAAAPQLFGLTGGVYNYYDVPMFTQLFVLHIVLVFVMLLTIVWHGTLLRLPGMINLGIVSIGVCILIQYFSWAFEMLDRSIAFILGGLLILALSAILERQRRSLLSSMRRS